MKIATKKLKSEFGMPVYGIGTWHMGGTMMADSSKDAQEVEAIKAALEQRVTHIDTAEMYGNGHAEELVAQAIKGRDRSKLFIVSKVWKTNLSYTDLLKACKASLERLGTDYLDLYLVHAPNPSIPAEETIRALDELKEQGLIKEIGVSNFSVKQLKLAQKLSKNRIVTNQIHYSLAYQDWQDVVDYCQENDVLVTAYRPIERGVLTQGGIAVLDQMSKKYNKTPAQIAINWLIFQDNVVTLAKTSNPKHLRENLEALEFKMEKEDIKKLGKEFPQGLVT